VQRRDLIYKDIKKQEMSEQIWGSKVQYLLLMHVNRITRFYL